jgi:hypothetical protein
MLRPMTVHSILPESLTRAAGAAFEDAGVRHVAHGTDDPVGAADAAVADPQALALLGPYRSAEVAKAVEASGPAGLALLAPVATWAGVTRDDEPGCDDPARHRGTVLLLAVLRRERVEHHLGARIDHPLASHVLAHRLASWLSTYAPNRSSRRCALRR